MSLAILFHFLCAQNVSGINVSFVRSLRLFCWIRGIRVAGWSTTSVSACNTDTTPTQPHRNTNTHRTKNNTTNVVIEQIVASSWWWIYPCNTDTTPTQPHRNTNTHRTKNNTTYVVIQQNSRKLLMMDILMSETCWAHKKRNKIASDIKLVFCCQLLTMMHSTINTRLSEI